MNCINELENLLQLKNNNQITLANIKDYIAIEKSFEEIEALHIFLINKVNALHQNEINSTNVELCEANTNASLCLENAVDAKIGHNIYFFNTQACYYIFGDIHADSKSVISFLEKIDFINKANKNESIRLLFLGDYVDRGKAPLKALELVLLLKYFYPEKVFLLRGNHDGGQLISENEYKLCVGRNQGTTDKDYFVAALFNQLTTLNKPKNLLRQYLQLFSSLCHIAFIKNGSETVMCVHGGIPRAINDEYSHLHSLSDLDNENIIDELGGSVIHNMLWSDPAENKSYVRNTRRFYFYENQFEGFIKQFHISTLIRGHEAFTNGFKEYYNRRLLCIFSSGYSGYSGCDFSLNENFTNTNDETAYSDIYPCVLKLEAGNKEIIRL